MKTVEGRELTEKQLTIIEPGEIPTFAAWLSFATVEDGDTWKIPLLLLTNRRFIISKEKLLGKPKANFATAWPDVSTVGSGSITPNFIELIVQTARGTMTLRATEYAQIGEIMGNIEYDFGWPHNEVDWQSAVTNAIKNRDLRWAHVVDSQYTLSGECPHCHDQTAQYLDLKVVYADTLTADDFGGITTETPRTVISFSCLCNEDPPHRKGAKGCGAGAGIDITKLIQNSV